MTAFYRFRLKPNSEYGYDVFVWEGIAPPTSSYKMVADISIDRAHAAFPSSPAGAMLYRYPITYITADTSEDPKFELNWLVSQYVNEVGVAFPVERSLRYGLLPETPILTEMFEVAVRVDGVSQAGGRVLWKLLEWGAEHQFCLRRVRQRTDLPRECVRDDPGHQHPRAHTGGILDILRRFSGDHLMLITDDVNTRWGASPWN